MLRERRGPDIVVHDIHAVEIMPILFKSTIVVQQGQSHGILAVEAFHFGQEETVLLQRHFQGIIDQIIVIIIIISTTCRTRTLSLVVGCHQVRFRE